MKITVERDNGDIVDITEGIQVLYDVATSGMDWGSGFLDYDEVVAIRKVGYACGFEHISYTLDTCACGHKVDQHKRRKDGDHERCSWGWRTHAVQLPPDPNSIGPKWETIVDAIGCSCTGVYGVTMVKSD